MSCEKPIKHHNPRKGKPGYGIFHLISNFKNIDLQTGDWVYSIQNTHSTAQVISMTVTTRAASLSEPPVTVKSYMNLDSNSYPNPMVVYAEVGQGFLPVIGANVIATVESESGTAKRLHFLMMAQAHLF